MVVYRTFRNTDPPAIVSLWRSRAGQPGLLQSVSADLFEQFVFGKLYFDYEGLVLAFEEGQPLGFAHAGFGPDQSESRLDTDCGVTCVVILNRLHERPDVADELLARCEQYLAHRGAKVLYGGGLRPVNPFYVGLYGGSELPGVLHSDTATIELFRRHQYREIDEVLIFQRNLNDFNPPVERQQVQLGRQMSVENNLDWPTQTWWQASTIGDFDLMRFEVFPRGGGPVLAHAVFRNMEPPGGAGFVRAAGLIDVEVHQAYRHRGLATFLLTEVFHSLHRQGITIIQSQATASNAAMVGLCRKLGFEQFDQGTLFRKE